MKPLMHFREPVAHLRHFPRFARFSRLWWGFNPVALTLLLFSALTISLGSEPTSSEPQANRKACKIIACDDPNLFLAPYVWKRLQTNSTVHAEATMPGAYIRARVQRTATIGIVIDGNANNGHPTSSMPTVEFSVDEGEFKTIQLSRSGEVYTLALAKDLNAKVPHRLDFYFRAANLGEKRWRSSIAHLRIAGLALDAGGSLVPFPLRPKRAIAYGDSITEGGGADGLFTSWVVSHRLCCVGL